MTELRGGGAKMIYRQLLSCWSNITTSISQDFFSGNRSFVVKNWIAEEEDFQGKLAKCWKVWTSSLHLNSILSFLIAVAWNVTFIFSLKLPKKTNIQGKFGNLNPTTRSASIFSALTRPRDLIGEDTLFLWLYSRRGRSECAHFERFAKNGTWISWSIIHPELSHRNCKQGVHQTSHVIGQIDENEWQGELK